MLGVEDPVTGAAGSHHGASGIRAEDCSRIWVKGSNGGGQPGKSCGLGGQGHGWVEKKYATSSMLASLNLGSLLLAVGLAAQGTDGSVGLSCTAPPWMSDSCRQPRPQGGQTHPHIPHAPQMSRCDESQNTLPTPRGGPALPWKEH